MKNYDALNGLVPKTQELHRAIFDMGYEQGFKDGSNSEYEHDHDVVKTYNDGQTFILDKIRAEIENIPNNEITKPIGTYDYVMGANNERKLILKIIDKYKAESEE